MTRRSMLAAAVTAAGSGLGRFVARPRAAQASTPAAAGEGLSRLLGSWTGAGTILGQPSTLALQWTPVLDGRFVRLTHTSRIGAAPRMVAFEGHAYYEAQPGGGYRATWFDSSGHTRPIVAVVHGAALVASWGTPAIEEGETTYRLLDDGGLEVIDRVRGRNGAWREFGRTRLSRTLPPG